MFTFNKIAIITLLACISCLQATEVLKVTETNPNELAVVTEVKTGLSKAGERLFYYKCSVGQFVGGRVACSDSDIKGYPTQQNIELTLRCPKSGTTNYFSYAEINYTSSSTSVSCVVTAGGVGNTFIQMRVNAYNTRVFDYSSAFYVY